MQYYKMTFLSKTSTKNMAWKLVSRAFLISKKSSVKKILWVSASWFGQILIDLKISFASGSYASFFSNTKGPGTSFQAAVFAKKFDDFFLF